MRRRHELTDEQWKKIEGDLPGKAGDPGRTATDNRLFVNAVLYVLHTGIPWADLPERFGKPNTLWKRYDRWAAKGVWERVGRRLGVGGLADPAGPLDEAQLDSTSVKAHPTASTGRREPGEKNTTPISGVAWADPVAPGKADDQAPRGGGWRRSSTQAGHHARPTR